MSDERRPVSRSPEEGSDETPNSKEVMKNKGGKSGPAFLPSPFIAFLLPWSLEFSTSSSSSYC
jgi:hypothetical protein